jgi:hypothetical protein
MVCSDGSDRDAGTPSTKTARIFMGIHFRFADTTALRQGRQVANWTLTRFLRPTGGRAR